MTTTADGRTVHLGDPEGAAAFLESRLPEDPAYDDEQATAIRMLLAERGWEIDEKIDLLDNKIDLLERLEDSREPVAFDAALAPCLGDLLRKTLLNPATPPERAALITAIAILGAARAAAGKPMPSKAWSNDVYLALEPMYRAFGAWADEEAER